MGVNTFLLDRRTTKLRIGGDVHSIGKGGVYAPSELQPRI
jgi:hypothetical protein